MKKVSYILTASLAIAMGFSSCSKDIDEINKVNPGQFSDSDPTLMITGAELANVVINEGELARLVNIFSGHLNGYDRQFVSYAQYNMTSGDFNTPWGNLYTEGIAQCRLIEAKAKSLKNNDLYGVAAITEANLLLTASAVWGDIPCTEACTDGVTAPKFDKMSDVTKYALNLLDSALAYGVSGQAFGGAYAGSYDWAEVANTLKARAYLRMKDYNNAITAASAGISAGNDLMANHAQETPGAWNLYYDFLDWNRGGYISCDGSHLSNVLDSGNAVGKTNAKTDEKARWDYYFLADNYTPLDPNMYTGIFAPTANFPIVSYIENELILAECYQRTGDNNKALDHLNNVRTSHATQFGTTYDAYVIGDFGPGAMVEGATAGDALLKEILVEKYTSLFGQVEPWSDLRRTKNLIGVVPYTGSKLPERFLYPQDEINANKNTPQVSSLFDVLELFQ